MEKDIIEAFKLGQNHSIKNLYNQNRIPFIGFAQQYGLSQDEILDIFQESFIALRKHAISGHLSEVKCGFSTYLFGIGKHLIYKKIKEKSKTKSLEDFPKVANDYDEVYVEEETDLTLEQEQLKVCFEKLGESCKQMLTLSFYRGLTNEEIANLQGYESEAVVRSHKSRCLKNLKELIANLNKS